MSSIEVVSETASARVSVPVVSREKIWEGAVVELRVPADARKGIYKDEQTEVHYLMFDRNVRGGSVHCFLHGNLECRGEKITAEVIVMRKTLADGRQYLYLELTIVPRSTKLTHRLSVLPDGPEPWAGYETQFVTPAPLQGIVILTRPDALVVAHGNDAAVHIVAPAVAKVATKNGTGDSQLDRLLGAGWQIERKEGSAVFLTKMRDGKLRRMTHHCPKKLR